MSFWQNDPWKTRTGGLVDMRRVKEKRGNEIVKSMNSNFAKETNQRDEDAEMQKFIEEHLLKKKEAEAAEAAAKAAAEDAAANPQLLVASSHAAHTLFKRPEDALFDVPKFLIENHSKNKSEESMSEQMLSGIPEVDLGVEERIRNIEDTERAKQKIGGGSHVKTHAKTGKDKADTSQQYVLTNFKNFYLKLLIFRKKEKDFQINFV